MMTSKHKKDLDLSKPSVWGDGAEKILRGCFPPEVFDEVVAGDSKQMYSDTLLYLEQAFIECSHFFTVEEICDVLDGAFCSEYKSMTGYHGTRIKDISSYQTRGILQMSPELMMELALDRLSELVPKEQIIRAVHAVDFSRIDTHVYLFSDGEDAVNRHQNHYLQNGSEQLLPILFDLKIANRGILHEQGSPYLLKCNVPLPLLTKYSRICTWKEMTTMVFKKLASGDPDKIYSPDSCFWCDQPIPPKNIETFINLDDEVLEYNRQIEH
jgi:hypothetical protein